MIKVTHQNRYVQSFRDERNDHKECSSCDGNGWIYEFYNDPVSWSSCPHCSPESER
ncbi:MAG TPA: hypothetical protein VK250_11580 [Nitrososphaeraceae archaeon]|nr:hypothetical protein [Nitrososphaeraceae archaeon]